MSRCDKDMARVGLRFFGTMTASISHELKNALAIINESAGLLEDFSLMAQKGLPLEPDRLATVAGRVQRQILRADAIVKNLNRFAHSVDEPLKEVDPAEVVQFVAALAQRLADRQGVVLETPHAESRSTIVTDPFHLETLIWHCIRFALSRPDDSKRIHIKTEETPETARICFTGLEGCPTEEMPEGFPGKEEQEILDTLGAQLMSETGEGRVTLVLPNRLQP